MKSILLFLTIVLTQVSGDKNQVAGPLVKKLCGSWSLIEQTTNSPAENIHRIEASDPKHPQTLDIYPNGKYSVRKANGYKLALTNGTWNFNRDSTLVNFDTNGTIDLRKLNDSSLIISYSTGDKGETLITKYKRAVVKPH